MHIVSERLLFRKTFSKLLGTLYANVVSVENAHGDAEITDIFATTDGVVLFVCDARSVDGVIECLLQVLTVQPARSIRLDNQPEQFMKRLILPPESYSVLNHVQELIAARRNTGRISD